MSFNGLAYCSASEMIGSPTCIEKAVEFSFTIVLLIAILVNLVMRISYQRQMNFYVGISLLMILTLLFNGLNTLLSKRVLYRFQNLFFDAYFPTLVYKFGIKLLEKNRQAGKSTKIIVLFYALYLLLVLGDFIYINVEDLRYCKQIPYLLVYSSGVSLSIWLAIFGYQLTKAEIRKNEAINQEIVADSLKYSNPMPKMWKCIVINILSQVIGLARTIYFVSDPQMNCRYTTDATAEAIIQFLFLVSTYYMGMVATLFFFNEKRKSYYHWNRSNIRKSSDEQKVELINISAFESKDKAML